MANPTVIRPDTTALPIAGIGLRKRGLGNANMAAQTKVKNSNLAKALLNKRSNR